jgi:hypothetical protein
MNRVHIFSRGHAVAQWLRHCATNWKGAGSIPNGVIGIFHWCNPSSCTMALRFTQPLTEMSTRNICWELRRPVHRADNLATFFLKSGNLKFLEPSGPVKDCNGIALPFSKYSVLTCIWFAITETCHQLCINDYIYICVCVCCVWLIRSLYQKG